MIWTTDFGRLTPTIISPSLLHLDLKLQCLQCCLPLLINIACREICVIMTIMLGSQPQSKQVQNPVSLLCSLSDSYSWDRYEPPYPLSCWLNTIAAVLLQWWLWFYITHKGWYAIKQRNQSKRFMYWSFDSI